MSTRQQKQTGYGLQPSRAASNGHVSSSQIFDSSQSLRSAQSGTRLRKRSHQPFALDENQKVKTHLQSQLSGIAEDSPTQNTSGTFGSEHDKLNQNQSLLRPKSFGNERTVNQIQMPKKNFSNKKSTILEVSPNKQHKSSFQAAKQLISPGQTSSRLLSSSRTTPQISALGRAEQRFASQLQSQAYSIQTQSAFNDNNSQDDFELAPSQFLPPQATPNTNNRLSKINSTQDLIMGAHLLRGKDLIVENVTSMIFQTPKRPEYMTSPIGTTQRSQMTNMVLSCKTNTTNFGGPQEATKQIGHYKNLMSFGAIQPHKVSKESEVNENDKPISFAVQSLKEAYSTELSCKNQQLSPIKQQNSESPMKTRNSLKMQQTELTACKQVESPKITNQSASFSIPIDRQNVKSDQKNFVLMVEECESQNSCSVLLCQDSPAKLQPFIASQASYEDHNSSFFRQKMTTSPSKIRLEPVVITQIFQKPAEIQSKPSPKKQLKQSPKRSPTQESPTRKALTQSRERRRRKGQGSDEVDERLVQAMIENLHRINQEDNEIQKNLEQPTCSMPNFTPFNQVDLDESFTSKPSQQRSQERRKRSQRLGATTKQQNKSSFLVTQNKVQRPSRNVSTSDAKSKVIPAKRDCSTSVKRNSSQGRQSLSTSKVQMTQTLRSKSRINEYQNSNEQKNLQTEYNQQSLNLTLTTTMTVGINDDNLPQFPDNQTLGQLKSAFPSPGPFDYTIQPTYEGIITNVFDAPLFGQKMVQAEPHPLKISESPPKRIAVHLKQTASSRNKSKEPSATRKPQKQMNLKNPPMQKSPQKQNNSFKKDSPNKLSHNFLRQSEATFKIKVECLRKQIAARKIQRVYKLHKQAQYQCQQALSKLAIEREQAVQRQQAELREKHQRMLNKSALMIQRSFRCYLFHQRLVCAIAKRQNLRLSMKSVILAWRTRRALNCLGAEVQEYVNCEEPKAKKLLRNKFHTLFAKVFQNKLYLEVNSQKLSKFIFDIEQSFKQKPALPAPVQKASPKKRAQLNKSVEPVSKYAPKTKLKSPERKNPKTLQKPTNKSSRAVEIRYQSCESLKSNRSVDQRVISELKQFIRNSTEKNLKLSDSYCSIQVISQTGFNQENGKQKKSQRTPFDKRENTIISDICSSQEESHKNQKISAKKPLKSESKKILNKSMQHYSVIQHHSQVGQMQRNKSNENTKETANGQENDLDKKSDLSKHAVGYRSKIKQVRARVDCWNRSVSRDCVSAQVAAQVLCDGEKEERFAGLHVNIVTEIKEPSKDYLNQRSNQKDIRAATRYAKDVVMLAAKEAKEINKNLNYTAKKQVVEDSTDEKPRQMTPKIVSYLRKPTPNPVSKIGVRQSVDQTPQEQNLKIDFSSQITSIQKQRKEVRPIQKSSSCDPVTQAKANALKKQELPYTQELDNSLLQTSNMSQMCSFSKTQPKPQQAPQKPIFEQTKTSELTVVPSQVIITDQMSTAKKTGQNLRQFITGTKRPTVKLVTNQVLKETITDLTSLMDNLSQEADTVQHRRRRQQVNTTTEAAQVLIPGFRTEQRAQISAVNQAEKNFRRLILALESQFDALKTQLLPQQTEESNL